MGQTLTNYRYKTFDQLLAGIESDFGKWADEGYIDRAQYLKVVRSANAFIGLRINMEREDMLEVKDHVALLPEDFQFLQLALACRTEYVRGPMLMGAQTESHVTEIPVENRSCQINGCPDESCKGPCENCIWITQKVGIKTHVYTDIQTLQLTQSSHSRCTDTCLNFHFKSEHQIRIQEDHATFSFREGLVYINYIADMLDENNNILILDHPLVNDFYEYAVKKRFMENMLANKEGDFLQLYQVMSEEYRKARIQAIGFVNTPEYGDLQRMFIDNRRRFYKKYIGYFNDSKSGGFQGEKSSFKNFWKDGNRNDRP
jgi:hypothetical protein